MDGDYHKCTLLWIFHSFFIDAADACDSLVLLYGTLLTECSFISTFFFQIFYCTVHTEIILVHTKKHKQQMQLTVSIIYVTNTNSYFQ